MPHQTKQTGHTFTSLMIHQMLTTNTFNLAPQSVTTHHSIWYQSIDNHATLPCLTISPPPILPQLKPTCMSSLSHLIKNYWKLQKTEKQLDIRTKKYRERLSHYFASTHLPTAQTHLLHLLTISLPLQSSLTRPQAEANYGSQKRG